MSERIGSGALLPWAMKLSFRRRFFEAQVASRCIDSRGILTA